MLFKTIPIAGAALAFLAGPLLAETNPDEDAAERAPVTLEDAAERAPVTLEDLGVRRNNNRPLVLISRDEDGARIAHFFRRGESSAYRSVPVEEDQPRAQSAAYRSSAQKNGALARSHLAPQATIRPYEGAINTTSFQREVIAVSQRYGVDPALVRAVVHTESSFNPSAASHANAVGLMQLIPETAERFGVVDRTDPMQSLEGGVRYLRFLLDHFDDVEHAIAAYNAGEGAVTRHNGIPPFEETQKFVPKVLSRYQRYKEVMGS
ncbi:Lytic transglycosylase catalytic (plasmid) [Thioalkalivibrio sp. K90mix]|uniref:lytic transglycosylase domain-containing protein n=1 Tax=Thioalkalivibrio sp. (strain K90mix) TaxID=396595 RepID=UPI000195A833|nr:lytic transglycosylase domain-containing protein [Thioalkalivibrio sp. K90mix]ADC73312.1 Lytic transglycosylase catalytic [Thioalkalivibrio sp. K90mix]